MKPFDYERPRLLGEVFELLDSLAPGDARILAGGTDLVVGMQIGRDRPRLVVDVKYITDLPAVIAAMDDSVSISCATTLAQLVDDATMRTHFPALVEAAAVVGSVQIRNRASLIGNICNASPAFDTGPALLAYDANIVLLSRDGERRLAVADFVTGPRQTALLPGEIATAVELRMPSRPVAAKFARLARRRGADIATLSLCCAIDQQRTRIAFGAVGPRPFFVDDETGVLADPDSSSSDRDAILRAIIGTATPISDVRATAEYRSAMLLSLSRRALSQALINRSGV
jgi:CO/xanthine dehydrogenase FAD-binding subunit